MHLYGPFSLNIEIIHTIVTRTMPGVVLLCKDDGVVEVITHSEHDVAEVLLQWVGRFAKFYFSYVKNGSEAAFLREEIGKCLQDLPAAADWVKQVEWLDLYAR